MNRSLTMTKRAEWGLSFLSALACLSALAAMLVAIPAAQAQLLYGSVVRRVNDPSGGAVPGATIAITNKSTNQSRETINDEIGNYTFSTVQTGSYDIKVSLPGFKEFQQTEVPVTLNSTTRVNVQLEVGQVAETVTVLAQAAQLQSDRAEVKGELSTKELENLPVPLGRNYQALFKTLPGFNLPENAHSI